MADKSRCHWIGAGFGMAIAGAVLWFFINHFWTVNRVGILERQGWPLSSIYVWVAAGAGLGIAAEVIRYRRERRRAASLAKFAEEHGFKFTREVTEQDLVDWSALPLFQKSSATRNHLAGKFSDVPAEMVDYTYFESAGENTRTYDQTVAFLPAANEEMPAFELTPRTFGLRMLSLMGAPGIEFVSQTTSPVDAQIVEKFNKSYHLSARKDAEVERPETDFTTSQEHQEVVRRWFSLDTLGFFANHPGWHVQSAGGRLAIWRPKKIIGPAQRSTFLQEALAARDALATTGKASRSRATLAAPTLPQSASIQAPFTAAAIGGMAGFFAGGIAGGIAAGAIFLEGAPQHDNFLVRFLLSALVFFGGALGGLFLGILVGRRAFTGLVSRYTARRSASVANRPGRLKGQPISSNAVGAQSAGESTITLPAPGLVRGCGCFIFVWALMWNLFLVIATPAFLISAFRGEMEMEGSDEPVHPAMMILFLTPFWIIGLTAIWFIIYRGRQRACVTVSPERLEIEEVSLLGTRRHKWRREELTAVRLVEQPENRSHLSIEVSRGQPVLVLKHRDVAELAWIARVLDDQLALHGSQTTVNHQSPA